MKIRCALFVLVLLASCNSNKGNKKDWHTLDFGSFTLKVPPDWQAFREKGVDSYVGGITNGKDSMWFDLGWYSAEINDEETENHLYAQDTINGLIGILQIPRVDGIGSLRLSIPRVNDRDKFSLGGDNIKDSKTILKIFKSVVFKESDTTINGRLNVNDFKPFATGSGRAIYMTTCTSCHHRSKDIAGPVLTPQLLQSRSAEWLFRFFSNRESVRQDSAYQSRKHAFEDVECVILADRSEREIKQLVSYIKGL